MTKDKLYKKLVREQKEARQEFSEMLRESRRFLAKAIKFQETYDLQIQNRLERLAHNLTKPKSIDPNSPEFQELLNEAADRYLLGKRTYMRICNVILNEISEAKYPCTNGDALKLYNRNPLQLRHFGKKCNASLEVYLQSKGLLTHR